MNQTIKHMLERRSIRSFKPDIPPKDLIDQVIEAGLYAASGRNQQASRIIAITNKQLRDEIAKDNQKIGGWDDGFDPFYGAPVILAVLAEKNWPTCVYDGSLVMGNLMLAAHSLGLASCWVHRAKQEFEMEKYQSLLSKLGLHDELEGIGYCALGYADGESPQPAPRKQNHVFYVE